ncbi:hypothetical protein GOODEAATRI_000694 [Goodea atripinnis]|uniref:Uncharacterized protein n=1 Tax=Goodea atripinnis TaxID=208336 RepID=A0ABV0NGV3_9TELE
MKERNRAVPASKTLSDYMVTVQPCSPQRQMICTESQDSRSPDSACSLGYDSRESSPDRILDDVDSLSCGSPDKENEEEEAERKTVLVTSMDEALRTVNDTHDHSQEDFLKQNFETLADSCNSAEQSRVPRHSMSSRFLAKGHNNRELQKRPQELLLNNSTSKPSFYFSSPSSGSPHTPPSPPPWESPKLKPQHSYMNPTASSKAKRSRSTSPRDNFQSCSPPHSPCFPEARSPLELEVESSLLSSSSVITFTSPISSDSSISLGALSKTSSLAHPHHTAARLTQNTQPSRIPLPKQPLSPRRSLCLDVKPIPGCSASRLRASTSTMDVRCDISPSPDKTQG